MLVASGIAVLAASRHHNPLGRRLLLTAFVADDIPGHEIERAGVDLALRKPLDRASFLRAIHSALYGAG
ncbi:MAG: hypothetical protein ACYDCK_15225 [Thermoplasmatota archaeon]